MTLDIHELEVLDSRGRPTPAGTARLRDGSAVNQIGTVTVIADLAAGRADPAHGSSGARPAVRTA